MISYKTIVDCQEDKCFQDLSLKIKYIVTNLETDEKEEKETMWIPKGILYLLDPTYYKMCMEIDHNGKGCYSVELDPLYESEEGFNAFLKDFLNCEKIFIDFRQDLDMKKYFSSIRFSKDFYKIAPCFVAPKIKELEKFCQKSL